MSSKSKEEKTNINQGTENQEKLESDKPLDADKEHKVEEKTIEEK